MMNIKIPESASDDFKNKVAQVDIDDLVTFLEGLDSPVYETSLMKFVCRESICELDSLTLYRNHFILFYILYILQDYFNKKDKFLYVHFMRTMLFDYPDSKHCHYFDEKMMRFCEDECCDSYCDIHRKLVGDGSAVETLSVKYFYLDTDNYDKLDACTADAFINGTWEILANYNKLQECFKIMQLSETYDLEVIKRQFRMLAKKYHPDVSSDNTKMFNEINRAYKILVNTVPIVDRKN